MIFNEEQLAVFDAALTDNNSFIVEALAGTGKTTVLVELLRYLKGSVFMCAFGTKSAEDLRSRASEFTEDSSRKLDIRTTNSLGMVTWMRANRGRTINLDNSKTRKLIDEISGRQPLAAKHSGFLVKLIAHAKKAGLGVLASIEKYENWTDLVKHYGLEVDLQGEPSQLPEVVMIASSLYRVSLDRCDKTIDYDDQVLAPLYHDSRFVKFDNVLLDEAQDTSPLRLNMILRMAKSDGRFIAVGDPNQSIMGFTGAHNESMKEIQQMTDAVIYPLSITYRVPQSGVALNQDLVPTYRAAEGNCEGSIMHIDMYRTEPAHLLDITMSGLYTGPADTVKQYIPGPQEKTFFDLSPFTADDAILCRNTRPLVELAYAMIRLHIPCRVEGRNIGEGFIRMALRWRIPDLYQLETRIMDFKRTQTMRLIAQYQDAEAESVADQCDTLHALIQAAMEEGHHHTSGLVSLIERMFGDTPEGERPSMCTLSTVHKAKGREWKRVFILGRHQYMPSKYAKQPWEKTQERNLIYVAQTRHKETLVMVQMPDTAAKGGRNNDSKQNGATQPSAQRSTGSTTPTPRYVRGVH